MTVHSLAELGRVHLIGIGGAGMSAVAVLLAGAGVEVSGSDAKQSDYLTALRDAGIPVQVGSDPAAVDEADTVVISTAIRPTNPVLVRAQERGLPVLHRAEALALAEETVQGYLDGAPRKVIVRAPKLVNIVP